MKNLGSSGTTGPTKPGTASALKSSLIVAQRRRAFSSLSAEGGSSFSSGYSERSCRTFNRVKRQQQQQKQEEDRLGVGRPRRRTVLPSVRRTVAETRASSPSTTTTTTSTSPTTTATTKTTKRRWWTTSRGSRRRAGQEDDRSHTGVPVCLSRCAFIGQRHYRNC